LTLTLTRRVDLLLLVVGKGDSGLNPVDALHLVEHGGKFGEVSRRLVMQNVL
jgi:hypothetical protein